MKPQVISQLVENVNELISDYPNFSLSSVCQLAGWNSSSYGRAIKSRGLEPIKGGKSNPTAHLQELIEANKFEDARWFLETLISFRAICLDTMNAGTPKAPQVETEEVPQVETEEAPQEFEVELTGGDEVELTDDNEVELTDDDEDEYDEILIDDEDELSDDDLDNLDE